MLFPAGDTSSKERGSRWSEIEFMYHEICAVLLSPFDLVLALMQWNEITGRLSDSKRGLVRQLLSSF
jgi:hypothetical protein